MIRPVAFVPVVSIAREGSRVRLSLECGHSKLHNPRLGPPRKAACVECGRKPS